MSSTVGFISLLLVREKMKNRSGSYKKILIDSETLAAHGEHLRNSLEALSKLSISRFEFTTLYLLLYLRIKHPENWLQKKSKPFIAPGSSNLKNILDIAPLTFLFNDWECARLKDLNSLELFNQYNLKAIPDSINRTMVNWQMGIWSIVPLEHIPGPRELLRLQVKNSRCITLITDLSLVDKLVFNTRDPLSFLLHDLMHADQFFNQTISQKGQLGFYKMINEISDQPLLKKLLKDDHDFKKEFEYVTSDMNAYVIHLLKCLKSSIYRTKTELGPDHFFHQLLSWWDMNELEMQSALLLNTPDFKLENELHLKNFFENHQEIL